MMVIVQDVFGKAKILQVWMLLFLVVRELNSFYRQHFPDWYYDLLFLNKDGITPDILAHLQDPVFGLFLMISYFF